MITSLTNQKIKNVVKLMTSTKERRQNHAYVIEGLNLFSEAPFNKIRRIFMTRDGYEKAVRIRPELGKIVIDAPMQNLHGPDCELVSDDVFKKMSDTATPQGILCVMDMPDFSLKELIRSQKSYTGVSSASSLRRYENNSRPSSFTCPDDTDDRLILVLEGIQDPGNLGTMLRTGEAAGVSFILADKQTVDLYSPKAIRSTMGAIFRTPVIYTDDLTASLKELKSLGVNIYAAHLEGRHDYWSERYNKKTAFLIGNEGNGLSDEISSMADSLIRIPMEGEVESLNAAIAASLLMFEYKRQFR